MDQLGGCCPWHWHQRMPAAPTLDERTPYEWTPEERRQLEREMLAALARRVALATLPLARWETDGGAVGGD